MRRSPPFNFGLVVAYLLPGVVVQWGLSYHSQTVHSWLEAAADKALAIGDQFYATLASVAAGVRQQRRSRAHLDTQSPRSG